MYGQSFIKISHELSVEVKPAYMEDKSNILAGKHVYAYQVGIRNMGNAPVQLMARHWEIYDSSGKKHIVNGEGVIGKQPVIEPGGDHNYSSFCVLESYRGRMKGYYTMDREDGKSIRVHIPEFLLVSHLLN